MNLANMQTCDPNRINREREEQQPSENNACYIHKGSIRVGRTKQDNYKSSRLKTHYFL